METRPQPKETEEDLLKQQEKFLSLSVAPSARVVSCHDKRNANHRDDPHNLDKHVKRKCLEHNSEEMEITENSPNLLLDIMERETSNVIVAPPRFQNRAFPVVPRISNTELQDDGVKGKSLFALHAASLKDLGVPQTKTSSGKIKSCYGNSSIIIDGSSFQDKNVAEEIHEENVLKLNSMEEDEILKEKNELLKSLDPKLMEFLRERRKQKTIEMEKKFCMPQEHDKNSFCQNHSRSDPTTNVTAVNDVEMNSSNTNPTINDTLDNREIVDLLPIKPSEAKKWLHMDDVESNKLEWMMEIPQSKDREIQSGYSARFDFEGFLLSRTEDIPTYVGLNHHGEEPDIPGYTLEEILQYSRSSVSQQRVLGLRLLTNVVQKANTGIYDEHLESSLMPQLIDAGILLMLRWAIDDDMEAVREVAIQALNVVLVNAADEICLDKTFLWQRGFEMPFLKLEDNSESNDDETTDKELSDAELLKIDAIKGLLRTDILPRLHYILKTHRPPAPVVISLLEILIRIARHSLESASAVLRSENLIRYIVNNFLPRHWKDFEGKPIDNAYGVPVPQALKLMRVLASAGKTIAKTLVSNYEIMDTVICYISLESSDKRLPVQEMLHLILEGFSMWHVLLSYGLCSEYYIDIFPLLMQQLQYCQQISLIEIKTPNSYDFNHCSALLNLLNSVVQCASFHFYNSSQPKENLLYSGAACVPLPVHWQHVSGLLQPVNMCAEKWLFELTISEELSFSALTMAGSAFTFLSTYYNQLTLQPSFQVVDVLGHLESFCEKILIPFLQSRCWQKILSCLLKCSNLLSMKKPGVLRDSSNLSSLGSILWGGSVVPVLDPDGTVHFLTAFIRFIITIMKVHKNLNEKVSTLILSNKLLIEYIKRVISSHRYLEGNWFTRYEIHFLYFILKLGSLKNHSSDLLSLHHHLAIVFISLVPTGDGYLVSHIMKSIIFNPVYLINENMITHFSSLSVSETKCSEVIQSNVQNLNLHESLQKILATYLDILETVYKHNRRTVLSEELHPWDRSQIAIRRSVKTLLPIDWMYLPLKLTFLNHFPYKVDKIHHCLKWIFILYSRRKDTLANIPSVDVYCYLSSVFLIGNDAFFDDKIRPYLKDMLMFLVHLEKKEAFKMESPLPFAVAFRDYYLQILTQFEAVSYGDHLFGLVVLLPLQQHYDQQLRIDLWTAHTVSLCLLSVPIKELPISLQRYLNPVENNKQLLLSYYQNILSETVNPKRCPILYLIAVHHLHHFLYGKNNIYPKMKLAMLNNLENVKKEVLKQHILFYGDVCMDSQNNTVMEEIFRNYN